MAYYNIHRYYQPPTEPEPEPGPEPADYRLNLAYAATQRYDEQWERLSLSQRACANMIAAVQTERTDPTCMGINALAATHWSTLHPHAASILGAVGRLLVLPASLWALAVHKLFMWQVRRAVQAAFRQALAELAAGEPQP